MRFNQAFRQANKNGVGIYREGWGVNAVAYVLLTEPDVDFVLENYSDNTVRTLRLTYKDIVAKDWVIVTRKPSMET